MRPPTIPEGQRYWHEFLADDGACPHRDEHPDPYLLQCACFPNYICLRLHEERQNALQPNPNPAFIEARNQLAAMQAQLQGRIDQEIRYRDERDRHFNRLLDIDQQVQSCVADIEPVGRNVSVEEFITVVRRELVLRRYRQASEGMITQQELGRLQQDLRQLYLLAEAAGREIGVHPNSRDFNIQGYIVASVKLIQLLRKEVQQKDVGSEYVQYLQERNREGARIINQMGEQLRGVRSGALPAAPGSASMIPSAIGAIGTRNMAPPITYEAFKAVIWPIYLGLFNSERNLRILLVDRQIEVPEWDAAAVRVDAQNVTYTNRWELAAHLVRAEVKRYLERVWTLYSYIQSLNIAGSQPEWNGPHDDDYGRAIHVHEAMVAAAGRGRLAQAETELVRQFLDPLTDMARKTDLEERHERRFPVYLELQTSITTLTQRIVMFRQLPPMWPEQHERDNTAAEPKRDYELLSLMLTRIEMEYLSIRLKQLLETVKNYWHLIPHGDNQMSSQLAEEISHAHGARVACDAELTRPSEIVPAPAYPGSVLPPYDPYMPYGRQFIPIPDKRDGNNKQKDSDKDKGNNQGKGKEGKGKEGKGKGRNENPDGLKKSQSNVRARIEQMQQKLREEKIQYKNKTYKGNFANKGEGTPEVDKLKAENDILTKYRKELEKLWKDKGKAYIPWPKQS